MPKIKHARLCRVLLYGLVLSGLALPTFVLSRLPSAPAILKMLLPLVGIVLTIRFVIRKFAVFMTVDLMLAMIPKLLRLRTSYELPRRRTAEKIRRSLARYGWESEPTAIQPRPELVRCRWETKKLRTRGSRQVYVDRTDYVILSYSTEHLDRESLLAIASSAKANVRTQWDKRRREEKVKGKLRSERSVALAAIFATRVDEALRKDLWDLLRKQTGDEVDDALLLCVLDLERRRCIFDSSTYPDILFATTVPAKTKAHDLVRRQVFGGYIPCRKDEEHRKVMEGLEAMEWDLDQSLWSFWRMIDQTGIDGEREQKKHFQRMGNGQVEEEEGYLYCKHGERGIWLAVELDEENQTAAVDPMVNWTYPKTQPISKADQVAVKKYIAAHFAARRYRAVFATVDAPNVRKT